MTETESGLTAAIGAGLLLVGILLAWYCEVADIGRGPALLFQSVGALLLTIGLLNMSGAV